MRSGQRFALAVVLALVALLAISGSVFLRRSIVPTASDPIAAPAAKPPEPDKPAPAKSVFHIEEVLAEEKSEDPGAVFFTSRIREAVREGNPAFGQELLRQMKEEHPSSVLVYEAEEILKVTR